MKKKNTIRLTESELKKVITESVKNIISEHVWYDENPNQGMFPEDLENALGEAYSAVDELLTLSNRYSQTLDDEYARRRAGRIKDAALNLMICLDNYVPGKREC